MDQQDGQHHAPKAHRKVYQPKGVSSYRWGKKELAGLEHAPVIADHAQDQRRDESVLRQALIKDLRRMDGQFFQCLPSER
jgi:hypothetical protein